MNWRLIWYKATHHLFVGKDYFIVLGSDTWNADYGLTFNRGLLPPIPGPSEHWKRWRVEWRINIRWPISVRRRVSRT